MKRKPEKLLLSHHHLHGENSSPQSAFYTDDPFYCMCDVISAINMTCLSPGV